MTTVPTSFGHLAIAPVLSNISFSQLSATPNITLFNLKTKIPVTFYEFYDSSRFARSPEGNEQSWGWSITFIPVGRPSGGGE